MTAWAALGAVLGAEDAGTERAAAGARAEGAVYRPAHWRKISMDGEMPQRRNCQAWVWPDGALPESRVVAQKDFEHPIWHSRKGLRQIGTLGIGISSALILNPNQSYAVLTMSNNRILIEQETPAHGALHILYLLNASGSLRGSQAIVVHHVVMVAHDGPYSVRST